MLTSPIKRDDVTQFIESAKKEINDNMYLWINENSIDISLLDAFKKYENNFNIKETKSPKHYINTSEIYITQDDD